MDEPTSAPEPASDGTTPDAPDLSTVDVGRGSGRHEATRRRRDPLQVLIAIGIVAVLALQIYLVTTTAANGDRIGDLEAEVGALGAVVTAAQEGAASMAPDTGGVSGVPAGSLPRHDPQAPDTALGLTLGPVTGTEYYSGSTVTIDPADGTRRVWLVWAHWCPYCQQELPELDAWYPTAQLEGMELVSVTTSIDPSRGNPLEPYLDDLQLPFAVVVDDDLGLARQLGVSAFPFWVVTDGDGTVLFRTAGYLPLEQVEAIFAQLGDLA